MGKNLTFYMSFAVATVIHALMLTLFYLSTPVDYFYIPKMTRVSFLPLDINQLTQYSEIDVLETGQEQRQNPGVMEPEEGLSNATKYWQKLETSDDKTLELPEAQEKLEHKQEDVSMELNTQRKVVRLYYPKYPLWAKKAGLQSDVSLRFQILENGQVGQLLFDHFSGHPELDALGLRAVRRWRFEALPDGVDGGAQWGTVKLKFRLNQ